MKAWKVWDNNYSFYALIIFAETRGKAIAYALNQDEFDSCEWTDLRANRFKEFDSHYKGSIVADWDDPETRIILVRDYSWTCEETDWYCDECPAKEWCSHWEDYEAEVGE